MLSMELTRGVSGAIPIAVTPFLIEGSQPPQDVSEIVTHDLQNSGRFKVFGGNSVSGNMSRSYFKSIGADYLVLGAVKSLGGDRYQVNFELFDLFKSKDVTQQPALLSQKFTVSGGQLRALSHRISDLIYEQITGVRGIFSTKISLYCRAAVW